MSLSIAYHEEWGVYLCHNSVTGAVFSFIGEAHLRKLLYELWSFPLQDLHDSFTEGEIELIKQGEKDE